MKFSLKLSTPRSLLQPKSTQTPRTPLLPQTPTSQTELKTIIINIYNAKNLPKADPTGLSDPYCIVRYQKMTSNSFIKESKVKTEISKETLNPTWCQSFVLENVVEDSELIFSLFDWDNIFKFSTDDFLGEFRLQIRDIPIEEKKIWKVPIFDVNKSAGELSFVTYAMFAKESKQFREKELKMKVDVNAYEMNIPQLIGRYHNHLEITIVKTVGLLHEKERKNVFAQVKVGKQILETFVSKTKGNPEWNTTMTFAYRTSNVISVVLRDWKMLSSSENIGSCTITLTDLREGLEIEKEVPLNGTNGKLICRLKITKFTNIKETLPISCRFNCGEDDWCKQNIQFFESFVGKPKINGIIGFENEENMEKYDFEMERNDISNIITDEEYQFNNHYFEQPITESILPSPTKKAYYNSIQSSIGKIIVVVGSEEGGMLRAVALSQMGRVKLYIQKVEMIDEEVMNLYGLKKEEVKMKELQINIWDDLKEFEMNDRKPQYKFGLVVATKGQSTEREFLANTEMSRDCQEFFSLIGKQIKLKGFTGYNGKLDCVNGRTGVHSIISQYKNNDIMFHVSTMLHHDENDPQFIAKKRHIGNDGVVIIFKEVNDPKKDIVKLDSFMSHYNHIYIVVTPLIINNKPVYRVVVCCKKPVAAFAPRIPEKQYFKRDHHFAQWLLCKCINGERAALESPQFVKAPRTVNEGFLERILKNVEMK